jgi:hyaluronoglucosaminidase
MTHSRTMANSRNFTRRGIVEGFFGPPWSMRQRGAMFAFGAARGMNTYLYAPKDDPYHREKWRLPYPRERWIEMTRLIRLAKRRGIDFVYGFHPGKGLRFVDERPVETLLGKASRFYDAGVRTFAVLFDDIPSRLIDGKDRSRFRGSLARAEGAWVSAIVAQQPASWHDVEWWICPSYYSEDALLERVFGKFEPKFLEKLAETLPRAVATMWTGPKVVSPTITAADVRRIRARIRRPIILWDNYPVNDLSMSAEMHLGPVTGRDPRLPEVVYGYLNNPLLQERLSFIPLATCFDYAAAPRRYDPEASWRAAIAESFGARALRHWRAIRLFCERDLRHTDKDAPLRLPRSEAPGYRAALTYITRHARAAWARELSPWTERLQKTLTADIP